MKLRFCIALTGAAVAISLNSCRQNVPNLSVQAEHSPSAAVSLVPQLTELAGGKILLSWQRPLAGGGYAFEMALKTGVQWSDVRTVAEGADLGMFPVDLPAVVPFADTKLLAYWEVKDDTGGDRYATTIRTAVSSDEGRTWVGTRTPYNESMAGQHSFLSWFGTKSGGGLLWLDAKIRSQVNHAAMHRPLCDKHSIRGSVGLRYASLDAEGKVEREEFVAPITCECCPTSVAVTARGPVVVYRGRQETPGTRPAEVLEYRPTVRDIYIVRQEDGVWQKPHRVHEDNWVINACPDNGPAVDARANHVAVAWWTRADNRPKVQLAFSSDDGNSFRSAFRIDSGSGEGQVTVSLLRDGRSAVVGWLEDDKVWARYVEDSGVMSRPVVLGSSVPHSRLPHWAAHSDGSITAAWTSKQDGSHVAVSTIVVQ